MVDPVGIKKLSESINSINESLDDKITNTGENIVMPFSISMDRLSDILDKFLDFLNTVREDLIQIDWKKVTFTITAVIVIVVVAVKSPELLKAFNEILKTIKA